jgi:hypothetical protein
MGLPPLLENWLQLLEPMEPDDFAAIWIPRFYGYTRENRISYRKAYADLFEGLTSLQRKTIQNWKFNPPSPVLKRYFRAVHLLFQFLWLAHFISARTKD